MVNEGKNNDLKVRRNSFGYLINQADKLFQRSKQVAKIKSDDFNNQIQFTYSYPLTFLYFIDVLAGTNIL